MVGYSVNAYHSASVFRHDCRDDSVEVEAVHIMESGEAVSGGKDNVVEGKYFTHEETFPKDMINIPVGKGPMLTRWCGGALSEACRTEGRALPSPTAHAVGCTNIAPPVLSGARRAQKQRPQLTKWVVQKSHLWCSVGRDALGFRSLRSG